MPAFRWLDDARSEALAVAQEYAEIDAWSNGRPSPKGGRGTPAIIELAGEHWSFTNLVEAYALRALRKNHQLRLPEIHTAVDYVERKLKVKHPLANEEFNKLQTEQIEEALRARLRADAA